MVHPADSSIADKIGQPETFILSKLRDAESSRDMFPGTGTTVRIAGECCSAAGNVDHLALGQNIIIILCKPYRPAVPQPLFRPSLDHRFHKNLQLSAVFLFIFAVGGCVGEKKQTINKKKVPLEFAQLKK
jgi:hypothetical protein